MKCDEVAAVPHFAAPLVFLFFGQMNEVQVNSAVFRECKRKAGGGVKAGAVRLFLCVVCQFCCERRLDAGAFQSRLNFAPKSTA